MKSIRGRLAPSPTGYLHLGNAWAFLLAWLACRSMNGKIILRIENLDPVRSRQNFADAIMQDLLWLGLDWDEKPYLQSAGQAYYLQALANLKKKNLVYPCYCTRKELRDLANAPHATPESPFGDTGAMYPGTCRNLSAAERAAKEASGRHACLRLRCPNRSISFQDAVYGWQESDPAHWGGDFALQRSDGVIAYQLAVVVDDCRMQINQIVRGADLLSSTPRQLLLFDLFDSPRPEYAHIPLLCDADGFRLAKRHNSLTLRALRDRNIRPETITGYLAWKAGLQEQPLSIAPAELAEHLRSWHAGQSKHLLFPSFPSRPERILLERDIFC